MVGIYKYACGLVFTGIIANTEEEAWAYLDKEAKEWFKTRYPDMDDSKARASRRDIVIKELKIV